MTEAEHAVMQHLMVLLDTQLPQMQQKARAEAEAERGKSLRCITHQNRLTSAIGSVLKAAEMAGFDRTCLFAHDIAAGGDFTNEET